MYNDEHIHKDSPLNSIDNAIRDVAIHSSNVIFQTILFIVSAMHFYILHFLHIYIYTTINEVTILYSNFPYLYARYST